MSLQQLIDTQRQLLKMFRWSPVVIGNNVYGTLINRDSTLCCAFDGKTGMTCPDDGITLSRLIARGKVGIPYLINAKEAGFPDRPDGSVLVIKKTKLSSTWSRFSETPPASLAKLEETNKKFPDAIQSCLSGGSEFLQLRYIGMDEFATETLIAYLIAEKFDTLGMTKKGHDFFIRHYLGTLCTIGGDTGGGTVGINLMDYASLGSLTNLGTVSGGDAYRQQNQVNDVLSKTNERVIKILIKPEVILSVVKQTLAALHFLQKEINFISGDFKAENVLIDTAKVAGDYMGMDVSGNLKIRISDFGKSSATIFAGTGQVSSPQLDIVKPVEGPVRLFSEIRLTRIIFPGTKPDIITKKMDNIHWFQMLGRFNVLTYLYTRHAGIPTYAALDWYIFIVSLLQKEEFFYPIMLVDAIRKIVWDPLWLPTEKQDAYDKVVADMKLRREPGIDRTISTLRGFHYRCDIISHTMKLLGAKLP